MASQRKFYVEELEWLDKHEPFYKEAYLTQHFVPLTKDFNSRCHCNFSCTTVRNRLQSYRNRINRTKLTRGPIKTIDLTVPAIKEEKSHRDFLDEKSSLFFNTSSSGEESIKSLFPEKVEPQPKSFDETGMKKIVENL